MSFFVALAGSSDAQAAIAAYNAAGRSDPLFGSSRHVIVCNQTQHAGRSSRILLVEYLKMEADQHGALPASYQAGCLAARHKYLRINEGVPAHMPEMADAR